MWPDQDVDRPEPAREDAAYDAVMSWEWEGGALAPAAGAHSRRGRACDARQPERGRRASHRPVSTSPSELR
jgi:hypothetical protein